MLDGDGGVHAAGLISLSATRTETYQRGRKKKREGGGALEEGEGNLGKEEGSLRLILPRGGRLTTGSRYGGTGGGDAVVQR